VISPSSASPVSPSQINPLDLIDQLEITQGEQEQRRSQISAADEVIAAASEAPEVPQQDVADLMSAREELVQEAAAAELQSMATGEALVGATVSESVAEAVSQNPDITAQEVVEVIATAAAALGESGAVSPDVAAAVSGSAPAIARQVTADMAARRIQASFRRRRDERRLQSEASVAEAERMRLDEERMRLDEEAAAAEAAAAEAARAAQRAAEDANASAAEVLRRKLVGWIGWDQSMGAEKSDPYPEYTCPKYHGNKDACDARAMCRWDADKSKCFADLSADVKAWKAEFKTDPLYNTYRSQNPRPLLSVPWNFSAPASPTSSNASSASRSSPVSPAGPRTRSRGKANAASQGKRAASPAGPRRSGRNK